MSTAHFCTVRYPVHNITTVLASAGACIPTACTAEQLIWALKKVPNPSWLPFFGAVTASCVPKTRPALSQGGIATLIVISIFTGIVVLATAVDIWRRWRYSPDDVPLASPSVTRFDINEKLHEELALRRMALTGGTSRPQLLKPSSTSITHVSPSLNAHESTHEDDFSAEDHDSLADRTNKTHSSDTFASSTTEPQVIAVPPPKVMWQKLLFCFSIAGNFEKLTKHFPNNKTNLNPLNAIRVVAMAWVVLGHTCLFTIFIGWTNPIQAMTKLVPSPSFQVLLNATLSVDVFFYLAGFLMAYFTLKELRQRKGRMNWVIVFVHRLWRMTPTMVMALFFCWTVAPSLGNGPWWRTFMTWTTEACQKYWWTNLLYINNFWRFDLEQTCLAWTWYMSTDMQFFLIAIPIVYAIYRWPKIGFSILALVCTGSLVYIIAMSATHHLSPLVINMDEGWTKYLYTKPYARISTFGIGIVGAYMLLAHEEAVHTPHGFRRLPTLSQTLFVIGAWVIAIVMVLVPVFGTYSAYQSPPKKWNTAENTIFLTFSRPVFTLGLAIMAHLVMTSRSAISLKDVLSHPAWTPFARLTFGAYLYHPIIMFGFYFSSYRPIEFTGAMIFQNWLSFTALSFLASLVSFLLIERPTENLEGVLIEVLKERAKSKKALLTKQDLEQPLLRNMDAQA